MNPISDSREVIEGPGSIELSGRREQGVGKSIHLGRLNIGPRLSLCFLVIVVLMLAGYGLLL